MGGVVHIGQINKSGLEHRHPSVVNSVDDLDSLELLNQIEHIVPVNKEPILLFVLDYFGLFSEQGDVPSEPLSEIVSFLVIDDLLFVVLVEVCSVEHDLF